MKHILDTHRLKQLGMLAICHLVLGGAVAATAPATASAPATMSKEPARTYTVVGYNRAIQQADFDGLGKPVVLQMQQHLKSIYSKLPDWQADAGMKDQPLNDGIVGRITLQWLQRYGYTFRIATPAGYAASLPDHLARVAAFGTAYPTELGALLTADFSHWEDAQAANAKAADTSILQRANTAELLELYKRYTAGRTPPPRPSPVTADTGYYTYELDEDDFALLQNKDQLMQMLSTLKDKPFPSLEEMRVGLLQTLGGMQELNKSLWPLVKVQAGKYEGYLINAALVERLEKKGGWEDSTLQLLRDMGTVYLQSRKDFDEKFSSAVTGDEAHEIAEEAAVTDNYHLDEEGLATIKNQLKSNVLNAGVPAAVVRMLEQIKQVNYPEAAVFRSAAISKIDFGLAMCKLNSPTNNAYVAALRINDVDLDLLEKQLAPLSQQSLDGAPRLQEGVAAAFSRIRALRAKGELCDDATDKEGKQLVEDIYMNYLGAAIEGLARKKIPPTLPEIRIKGGKCGCALDDVERINYAFYPYWKDSGKDPQVINFRPLNRIAFQALTVDNFGNFQRGTASYDVTTNDSKQYAFVRTAHQYNTKVDWIIQKNDWGEDWKNYSPQSRKVVFAKIRDNILALLTVPPNDTVARIKSLGTLGLGNPPHRGDGVTLYFPNYPTDAVATAEFNLFFLELRQLMDKNDLGLNILVSQNVLAAGRNGGHGAFGLANLINLRGKRAASEPSRAGGPENDEFILVLLNESSSSAKKALRAAIESDAMLHGFDRADFLRSILPVLHFDKRNWQQLEDDIVYARDNFGGLGLWAPDFDNLAQPVTDPAASCLKSMQLTVCLSRNYLEPESEVKLPGWLEVFSCVQRWSLRLAWCILAVIFIAIVVLFFRFCGAQNFLKRNFLYVLAVVMLPAALIFIMLLLYDPLLARLSHGNLPFIGAVAIGMAALFGGYVYLRKSRRVPVRQRSTAGQKDQGYPRVVWRTELNEHGFQWTLQNTGDSYALIKRVEILYDNLPCADVQAVIKAVRIAHPPLDWKETPLPGKKLKPRAELLALTISDPAAAKYVEKKLKQGKLVVNVVYAGPGGEHWISDGKEVRSIW